MNKDNAKNYLPLVQALADGKVVQYLIDKWVDIFEITFGGPPERYRIKPAPKTMWVNIYSDCETVNLYPTREQADMVVSYGNRIACIEISYTEGEGLGPSSVSDWCTQHDV